MSKFFNLVVTTYLGPLQIPANGAARATLPKKKFDFT